MTEREQSKKDHKNRPHVKHGKHEAAEAAVSEIEEDSESLADNDSLNFLGNNPDCRTSNDSWVGEF